MKLYNKAGRKIFVASVSANIGGIQYDSCPKIAIAPTSKSGQLGDDYRRGKIRISKALLKAGFGI
ncbi:MAG TPA: hypothetical protein VND15_02605 [Candidatus Acidoferrales bacterium]|nr:hypothetical protein [Candidatus Acidoferrales bacterium]